MEENKTEITEEKVQKNKEYLAIALAGVAGGIIGGMISGHMSPPICTLPNQTSVVLPPQEKAAPSQAPSQTPTTPPIPKTESTQSSAEIAMFDFNRVMSEHPLIKQAEPLAQEKFKAAEAEINQLPEQERAAAWQKKNDEIMKEMQETYVAPAEKEINEAVDKVLAEKGIKTCLANANVFRGGVDITEEVLQKVRK